MGSIQNTVYYCCVAIGTRVLYAYNGGDKDKEIESLATLCLEKAPPYHKWYFQTMHQKTFAFLMEDGYVYFAIVDEGLGNAGVLKFLGHLRDEFRALARKGLSQSMSNLSSLGMQDQLVPVIHRLITLLQHVSESSSEWPREEVSPISSHDNGGQREAGASMKSPLLGKSNMKEKRKSRDHIISLEEQRKSTGRGSSGNLDSNNSNQGPSVSGVSLQKESSSMRRASTQPIRNKWCRQVRIILAIDAAVCLVLFLIWMAVCGGFQCMQ